MESFERSLRRFAQFKQITDELLFWPKNYVLLMKMSLNGYLFFYELRHQIILLVAKIIANIRVKLDNQNINSLTLPIYVSTIFQLISYELYQSIGHVFPKIHNFLDIFCPIRLHLTAAKVHNFGRTQKYTTFSITFFLFYHKQF